jgi:hypothetical protein
MSDCELGPGVEVRCIKLGEWRPRKEEPTPQYGKVYVVRQVYEDFFDSGVETFLTLEGFFGGWAAVHFEPIRGHDISALRDLLKDIPIFDRELETAE